MASDLISSTGLRVSTDLLCCIFLVAVGTALGYFVAQWQTQIFYWTKFSQFTQFVQFAVTGVPWNLPQPMSQALAMVPPTSMYPPLFATVGAFISKRLNATRSI